MKPDRRFRYGFGDGVVFRGEGCFVVQRRYEAGSGPMGSPPDITYKVVPVSSPNADGFWAFEHQLREA